MRILFADKGRVMHRTRAANWGLAMALILVGAAPAFAVGNLTVPAKYKQVIADGDTAKTLRSRLALVEPLEVSPLRPSLLTQPGEWNACIKVVSQGVRPPEPNADSSDVSRHTAVKKRKLPLPLLQGPVTTSYYAIFFRNGEIVDGRRAVLIDRCEQMQYSPLPKASKPKADSKADG